MPDIIDKANDLAEMEREAAIRAARKSPKIKRTGECHNCMEPISQGLYCDALCADDHARRVRVRG